MYMGVNVGNDNLLIVTILDENRVVKSINKFWKEGFLWFVEHTNPKIISMDAAIVLNRHMTQAEAQLQVFERKNPKIVPPRVKLATELTQILKENYNFEIANEETIKDKSKKLVARTFPDAFYKKFIRRELLPPDTREGLEQRLYNLPKTGVVYKKELLEESDKKFLRRKLSSVICAFCSYSIDKNNVEIYGDKEEEQIIIPKYKFVPKKDRYVLKED
ncbi:MAG: hypothetical protein GXO22_05755 [Aquificae bacterium]|nr:hypothetical protein [Aquificota bacterium]